VSIGKTSFPGNGVGGGVNVAVGGKGDGVNVAVAGIGDAVIVGAGGIVAVGTGSGEQPAMRMSNRINARWYFMMLLLESNVELRS
jgi:hypothetical protein